MIKIIENGIYHNHSVGVRCEECQCYYTVDSVLDVDAYDTPIKRYKNNNDYYWIPEVINYYTTCPECGCKSPLTDYEYKIVRADIKRGE